MNECCHQYHQLRPSLRDLELVLSLQVVHTDCSALMANTCMNLLATLTAHSTGKSSLCIGSGDDSQSTPTCAMQVLNTDYSALVAASCMNRLAKLSARFIGNRGFSIGIDDVTPAPRLVEKKQHTVSTGYAKVQEYIKDFSQGRLKLESGCDSEQSLEKVVTDALNDVREKAAKVRLHSGCHALLMAVTHLPVL